MFKLACIVLSLAAVAFAGVIPAAPLLTGPAAIAALPAPIVTARSSQVVARNYNTFAAAPLAAAPLAAAPFAAAPFAAAPLAAATLAAAPLATAPLAAAPLTAVHAAIPGHAAAPLAIAAPAAPLSYAHLAYAAPLALP
ncbi:uncharacterized protein LOC143154824 [Ptiloglossa arizonensis]|uniref:uncharacterized protein LOC143154824 n=1 Tax=Ptiloglossa arizonensis TaxID=3350558 RepID=UPI003F9F54AE